MSPPVFGRPDDTAGESSAALGWNALLAKLREQEVSRKLEERLLAAGNASGDGQRWKQVFLTFQEGLALCDCNDTIIDGPGDDVGLKGDAGDDTFFLGPGADRVWPEGGDDTVYAVDDGVRDVIRCDDMDDPSEDHGSRDSVVYIGRVDRADVVWPSCEIVVAVGTAPAGWPY